MVKIVVDGDERVLIDPAIILRGEDGKDGLNGRDGIDGKEGPQGLPGKDGRDGIDGKDGKDGTSYWIEYDKKKETLIFKNDGGKKNPEPIKLSTAKGWGYGAGGRGGVTAQSDWNQTDPHAVDFIKNKPEIHNVQLRRVDELPDTGEPYILYLVPVEDPQTSNIYDEYIWAVQSDDSYDWEKLGTTEIDLSGYLKGVQINDVDLAMDANNKVNIPLATLGGSAGAVKLYNATYGLNISESGYLYIAGPSNTQITNKDNINNPLLPRNIDLITKVGLTTNTLTFTDAEKQAARTLIGAGTGNSNLVLNTGIGLASIDGAQYNIIGNPTITDGVASGFSSSNYLTTKGKLDSTLSNDGDLITFDFSATPTTVSSGGSKTLYSVIQNAQNRIYIYQSTTRLGIFCVKGGSQLISSYSSSTVFTANTKSYFRIIEKRVSSSSYTFELLYSSDGSTYTSVYSTTLTTSVLGTFNGESLTIGVLPSAMPSYIYDVGSIDLKDFKITRSDKSTPWVLNAKGGTLVQANLASSISSASTHEELVSAKLLYEELEKIKALI